MPRPFAAGGPVLPRLRRGLGRGDDGRAKTEAVVAELRRMEWKDGVDLRYYLDARPLSAEQLERLGVAPAKRAEARASQHNELYWRLRVDRPLEFLFPAGGG